MNKINTENSMKIKRTFVKDEAYNILEEEIINGVLEPNERLNITDLTDRLGISRTPVREAILRLENEGLVLSKANQRTIVAPIDLNEAKDIYPLVYQLESYALRDGFSNIDDKFIESIEKINEKIKQALDSGNLKISLDLDNEFHRKIITLSPNKEILPIITDLKKRLRRIELYYFKNRNSDKYTYDEHKKIIKTLKEGNLEKSLSELRSNRVSTLNYIDYSEI